MSTEFGGLVQGRMNGAPNIKVVGIGGGGSNAIERMFVKPIPGVEYVVMNTDLQAIQRSNVPHRVQLGQRLTRGLGVGGDPEIGRLAAEENRDELAEILQGADMIFLGAGMGGGTGTGAAPIVADVARESGALTVAMVTKPFAFEGNRRRKQAEDGVHRLKDKVDSLIIIPNDRLSAVCSEEVTIHNAFSMADDVLNQGVQAIAELVTVPGEINLDFADVKTVMAQAGPAWMGIGYGSGESRALQAAREAVACPLLEVSIEGSRGVLFNIAGGENLTLMEVQAAADCIGQVVDPDANIFFGMMIDPAMENDVRITIIATGFPSSETIVNIREQDLAKLIGGQTAVDQGPDIDLPPFLRNSPFARRRLTSPLDGI
jgi:cell division protein FtsZ